MGAIELDMTGAYWDWTDPIQFNVVKTIPVDGEAIEVPQQQIVFDGMLQPLTPRELLIKPEGERKWKWWTLWTEQPLDVDSILQDEKGDQYRVMKQAQWKVGNFFQYDITQGPKPIYAGQ